LAERPSTLSLAPSPCKSPERCRHGSNGALPTNKFRLAHFSKPPFQPIFAPIVSPRIGNELYRLTSPVLRVLPPPIVRMKVSSTKNTLGIHAKSANNAWPRCRRDTLESLNPSRA